jgi:hypothetical protein
MHELGNIKEFMDYSKTTFKLIPIIPNTKKPRDKGWQEDIYRGTDKVINIFI